MPEFHRLNKTHTTQMSKEELNKKLREEADKSAAKPERKKSALAEKKQQKISAQTKNQMPPRSPAKKQREEELKRREKEEKKAKKRRRRGNYVIYYIMLAIVAVIIFAILSVTVLFNCEEIIVEGESKYTAEEIIEASGLRGDENLVKLSLLGIDRRILNELVSLDSAVVSKEFPNKIKITVTPAEPMVNFYYAGKNYVISYVGRVMEIERNAADCMEVIGYQPGDNVVVGDYITAANPEQDETIKTISSIIDLVGITEITELDITDMLSISLVYDDRIEINLGSMLQLEEKLTIVKELAENYIADTEKVTLDVSNPERVVQRPITPLVTSVSTTAPVTEAPEEAENTDDAETPDDSDATVE